MTTTHRRKLVLTALGAATAVALLCGTPLTPRGAGLTAPVYAQDVKETLSGEWDKSWERTLSESAKTYEKLYKWCVDKKLAWTAIDCRRKVLRYDPENEDVRKFCGYEKESKAPDARWVANEFRRGKMREESDVEDPKAQKFPEQFAATTKKVAGMWKTIAQKAKANSAVKGEEPNAAAWAEKAARAWERVLQVDSTNVEAHTALNHPRFGNKLVRPEALPFLKVRDERKTGGQKRANVPYKSGPADLTGPLGPAGLVAAAATSEHFMVTTVHGKDKAALLCVWAERTLNDFLTIYGVGPEVKDHLPWNVYHVVKDKEELKKVLKSVGWTDARIDEFTKHFGGATGIVPAAGVSTQSGGADADDYVIHYTGHALSAAARQMAVLDVGSPNEGEEDWLKESIAYDLTRRLTGTTYTHCGAFGKYGTDIEPSPDKDIWMELAKRQVESDDDVSLTRIWKCKHENQDLKGPEQVKGFAFIQFLFESDTEKARKFVWTALAQGTPKAVETVYGVAMETLDEEYRNWILKTW